MYCVYSHTHTHIHSHTYTYTYTLINPRIKKNPNPIKTVFTIKARKKKKRNCPNTYYRSEKEYNV